MLLVAQLEPSRTVIDAARARALLPSELPGP